MRFLRPRLFALFVCLVFGVCIVTATSPVHQAHADIASTVNVVPVNGGRVQGSHLNLSDAGTSAFAHISGVDGYVNRINFGSGLGNAIVAVSFVQLGNSGTAFGVKANNTSGGAYPYSSFLQYDAGTSTFFFRCLNNSDCHTGTLAQLQHDANYVISAYALQYDAGDIKSAINNLQSYIARCQDWLQIVANNVTNVNNSVDSLIKTVQNWSQVIDNHIQNVNTSTYNNGLKLAELDKKMAKLLENQQKAEEQAKIDRDNASNKSNDANKNLDSSKDKYKPDTAKLSSLVAQLASAQPSNCTIDLQTQGLDIPLDMCNNELPSWVTAIMGLVSAVSAVFVTIAVIRKTLSIFSQVNRGGE